MKKIGHLALISINLLSILSGTVFANSAIKPYVTTGFTVTKDYTLAPLLAVSQTNGKTWSYPTLMTPFDLDNVNCSRYFCVMDGFLNYKAALGISIDQGKSWAYMKPLMQSDIVHSQNISCDEQACYIVGYRDLNQGLPVIATSTTGLSWKYQTLTLPNISEPPYFSQVDHIACTNKSCVITGDSSSIPFVGVSQDHGASWTFPPLDALSKTRGNHFSSVHCQGDICAISGSHDNRKTPFLLISHDAGQSWHVGKVPPLPDLGPDVDDVSIRKINCSDSWCTAVGIFYTASQYYSPYPAVIISKDKGETWSYPSALFSLVPKEVSETLFNDVSCHDDVCMAVGGFVPKSDTCVTIPLVVSSTDKGETWTYQPIRPSNISSNILKNCDNNGLYNISCDENGCIAAGSHQSVPLLAVTHDKGKTWFYPFDKNVLPSHFSHGGFRSGTSHHTF